MTENLPGYLLSRCPGIFWIEEVCGFALKSARLGGKSACELVEEQAERLGYSCKTVEVKLQHWIACSRGRLFLIGVSRRCGGARALNWIVTVISAMQARRAAYARTSLIFVLGLQGGPELRRREAVKAVFVVQHLL